MTCRGSSLVMRPFGKDRGSKHRSVVESKLSERRKTRKKVVVDLFIEHTNS